MMERISWQQYFMAQCHLIAERSTCTRLMVGAVIVRNNRIIASGYNGSVADGTHCIDEGCYVVDNHCIRTVHAEANALLQCARFGIATENTEIYVTHYPCVHCCKQLIQAGVKAVYYASDYRNHDLAVKLFSEANIKTEQVTLQSIHIEKNNDEKKQLTDDLIKLLEKHDIEAEKVREMKQLAKKLY